MASRRAISHPLHTVVAVSERSCGFSSVQGETVALSTLADLKSGGTPSKGEPSYWGGDIPWLTPKDMSDFTGLTQDRVTPLAIGNGTRIAPANSVFVAVRGMSLHNEIRVVFASQPMAFNQDIKAVVTREVNPAFLYYALTAAKPKLLSSVEAAGHGTGVLPTDKLSGLEILRLATVDQAAIAQILSSLDDKIELNRRTNQTLEAMARALFKDWFVDFGPVHAKMEGQAAYLAKDLWNTFPTKLVASIPETWDRIPLDQAANFLNGLALQKFPPTGFSDLPAIKIADLRAGFPRGDAWATGEIPASYVINDGDVIFSWSGSLIQRIWTGGKGALNQHLFKVTSDRFPKWFYYLWVDYHLPEFQRIAAAKATTMGHIQRHHLRAATVVVPSASVLASANTVLAPMLEAMIENDLESKRLSSMRDSLLPMLISGELRIKDPQRFIEEAPA
jgi:type I restriction enzyme, S subunit